MIITKPKNFDLDQIYESGQCFRWEKRQTGGYYLPIGNGNNKISIWDDEKGFYSGEPIEYSGDVFNYFDLGTDYLDIETEAYRTHDQYLIKCYEFGKGIRILRQDLWEKGVEPLAHLIKEEPEMEYHEWVDKKTSKKKRQNLWMYQALRNTKTAEDRRRVRSKTFPGIAKAMADQWGKELSE